MSRETRNTLRRNPRHHRVARETAELAVLSDAKLLGIPSVRRPLIRLATLMALGCEVAPDARSFRVSDGENEGPMREALETAVALARAAIGPLGPLRPARPRSVAIVVPRTTGAKLLSAKKFLLDAGSDEAQARLPLREHGSDPLEGAQWQ